MTDEIIERKNYNKLLEPDKKKFTDAIRLLQKTKQEGSPFTYYEKYVRWHVQSMSIMSNRFQNKAHGGPVFLPWHREFLRRFEVDMRTIAGDNTLFLPYWDWTEDQNRPQKSKIWNEDFMGGNGDPDFQGPTPLALNRDTGYAVTDGPFKYNPSDPSSYSVLMFDEHGNAVMDRNSNPIRFPLLRWFKIGDKFPTLDEVKKLQTISIYDSPDWYTHINDDNPSFRNTIEGWKPAPYSLHNNIHTWVSGVMEQNYSPADPVFFLNHCNVDRLWAEWQKNKPEDKWYPADGEVTVNGKRLQGHNRNDLMYPWDNQQLGKVRLESVLDHHKLQYKYDTEHD